MNKRERLISFEISAAFAVAVLCFASSPSTIQAQSTPSGVTSEAKTPRTPDGHPDLTALWTAGRGNAANLIVEVSPDGKKRGVYIKNDTQSDDAKGLEEHVANRAQQAIANREKETNKPPYKPELLAKVKDLEDHYTHTDPTFTCGPPGVPRLGPASQIVQSPGQVVFLYATGEGNYFRVIPTDGRAHRTDLDPSYMGDSVGHWEGDTLVVDVIGFNDETWLTASRGYFHSEAMHVIERYTREGNTLHYQATVEDPNVFTRPWTMNPRTLRVGGADSVLEEADPCHDLDEPHMPKDYSAPLGG